MTLEELKHLKEVAAKGLPWDEVPCSTLRVWYKIFSPTQVAELLELAEIELERQRKIRYQREHMTFPKEQEQAAPEKTPNEPKNP